MNNTGININNSVVRLFNIIETMAKSDGPCELRTIALQTQLPSSTVYRFLQSLMALGYVKQDNTQRYYLTFKIVELANMLRKQFNIINISSPYLKELSLKCKESASLVVESDMMALYIYSVEGPDSTVKTFQRIGYKAPLHCTGVGKVLLSGMTEESLNEFIKKYGLPRYTDNTITNKNEFINEIRKVKELSYAYDNEECEIGARCVAAPIKDYTGKIVAAISVSGPTARMTDEKCNFILKEVLDTAKKISTELGYKNIGSTPNFTKSS